MTALGRILQVIGWLWIALGFFGPAINFPDVSVFPGIIILFISRVIRKQSRQTTREEEEIEQATSQSDIPRMLNTDRTPRPAPEPTPIPEPLMVPDLEPVPNPKTTYEPKPKPKMEPIAEEKSELLERVLLASEKMVEKSHEPAYPKRSADGEDGPLTSAEMIARAHSRWDRKP